MSFSYSLRLPVLKGTIFSFFHDMEKWFRLNPQWTVLSAENCRRLGKGDSFVLKVRYDSSDEEVTYNGVVERFEENELFNIRLESAKPRFISVRVEEEKNGYSLLSYEEFNDVFSAEQQRDIRLWLNSIANYVLIQEKKTLRNKLCKWFIDNVWLKMGPPGRRLVLFVVIIEGVAFAFFLLLLGWLLIFKKF